MPIDTKTRNEIVKKARMFDVAKEQATTKIKENVSIAIEKLISVEKELLDDVAIEFGSNPFSEFLAREHRTDDELEDILSTEVPIYSGLDGEMFESLLKEIDSFRPRKPKKGIERGGGVEFARSDSYKYKVYTQDT